ncbi:hypothetical protein ACFE04_009744 [Oxalis oulophora]
MKTISTKTLHLVLAIACVASFAIQVLAGDPIPDFPLPPFLPIPQLPLPLPPWFPFPLSPKPSETDTLRKGYVESYGWLVSELKVVEKGTGESKKSEGKIEYGAITNTHHITHSNQMRKSKGARDSEGTTHLNQIRKSKGYGVVLRRVRNDDGVMVSGCGCGMTSVW